MEQDCFLDESEQPVSELKHSLCSLETDVVESGLLTVVQLVSLAYHQKS